MVLSEQRYKAYKEIAPLTGYFEDFKKIFDSLIEKELDYKKAITTIDGTPKGNPKTDNLNSEQEKIRQDNLSKLEKEIEELRKQKDEFLSGNMSLEYTRKLNFLMDPILHE
jgi:hypothetical protein